MASSRLRSVWRLAKVLWENLKYRTCSGIFSKCNLLKASISVEGRRGLSYSDARARCGMDLDILDKKLRRLQCKLKKHEVNLEIFEHTDISYGALLGKGGEGEVRRCTVVYNNMPVEAAVKTLLDNTDEAISITLDEVELLCLSRDPIINTTVQVYGVAAVPTEDNPETGNLVILTEAGLMNCLQLYQDEQVPLHVTLDLWKRLAASLYTMHSKHIIHHDLKPENILITAIQRDKTGQLGGIDFRIIDLGMGKRVFSDKVVTEDILGTNGYHAPEILKEDSYDFRADVFMLGITFCVMLHSCEFLRSKSSLQGLLKQIHLAKQRDEAGQSLLQKIIQPTFPEHHTIPASITDMICEMLAEQEQRIITLLDVVRICDREARNLSRARPQTAQSEPTHNVCANCQDSGISSGDGYSRSRPRRGNRRAARYSSSTTLSSTETVASVSSTMSTVTISDEGEDCNPTRQRQRPGVGASELNYLLNSWEPPRQRKRTRGGDSRQDEHQLRKRPRPCYTFS